MATSGDSTFNATRDQIIRFAARKCRAIGSGETPGSQLVSDFAFQLNAMVKQWQVQGLKVWTRSEAVLFPQVSQVKYTLGPNSTDHAVSASGYVETAIATAAADGAASVVVDSISGISDGDYVGVVVDDGTIHWTTVNGSPAGSTITLTAALDDSAAVDNIVYAYTTPLTRPIMIESARWFDEGDSTDRPMVKLAREEYFDLPNKTQTGEVTNWHYDPQLTDGDFYIWNALSAIDGVVKFTYRRAIEDFDAAGNNPDLPQEWINALGWNLAMYMAPEYGVPIQRYQIIRSNAVESLDAVFGFDQEQTPVRFGVAYE